MTSRLLVAIPGIAIILLAVALGGPVFALFALAVAIGALFEFYSLTAAFMPLRAAGYATAVATVLLALWVTPSERAIILALALGLLFAALAALRLSNREEITLRVGMTLFGAMYIAFPVGVLVLMRGLPDGAGVIVNLLVGVWIFDTFSYFGGKLWGSRPIAPRTSPNKTWEGFITGVAGGTLGVFVAGLYMDWINGWQSLIVGVVICLSAFIGDLFESMIKRDAGVKDSGRILMGHGGVLDRFDSLLFASLGTYLVTVWLIF